MKRVYVRAGLLYVSLIFLTIQFAAAQSCEETSVTLTSQADVDSFPQRGCRTLCSLSIRGNDITNLDSLYVLDRVGSLAISFCPVLANINGLSSITRLESSCSSMGLSISSNNMLTNLDGLSSLTKVTGSIEISSNTMLWDISGLSGLDSIGTTNEHRLEITSNASLGDIDGLERVKKISGPLAIGGNPGLSNINGLSGVELIGGAVHISGNDALTNFNGLSSLAYIGFQFIISNNPMLTSIAGLRNLNRIGAWQVSSESLTIENNDALTTLDGLQGLDIIPGTLMINGNQSLLSLEGLDSIRTVSGGLNAWVQIKSNNSLTSVSALSNLSVIGWARGSNLEIISNPQLEHIDMPALTSIQGALVGVLNISDNASLKDIGLTSLHTISGGISAVARINNNAKLDNIDGLSSLTKFASAREFSIKDNPTLGRFCGLFNLFHSKGTGCGSPECYSTSMVVIEGNERNPTPEQIEAEGPCDSEASQPTNMVFSNVTSEGMRMSFNRTHTFSSGYLVLMKTYGPPAPEVMPVDGDDYRVGQVLNGSTIVVSSGPDSTVTVTGLVPATPYYFNVFSWKLTENGKDYYTVSPLEGHQSTTAETNSESTLVFTDIQSDQMTVALQEPQEGNYIALMKAFGYPSPNDVPVNGREYRVGNTIGSSTIVVNIGDGSPFTVTGLMPGTAYYFDIFKYDPTAFTYEPFPSRGTQATAAEEELLAYPNPFVSSTTIPFVVAQPQTAVKVAIYDLVGREISVLTAGSFEQGRYEASWDGSDSDGRRMNPGVYIYSVKSEKGVTTGRVSLN